MNKINLFRKFFLGLCACLIIFTQSTNVFARQQRGRPQGSHRGSEHEYVAVGHQRYHYRDGRFYRLGWLGLFEIAVNIPPTGAVVSFLPARHRTIVVGHNTYYYYDGIYYTACPSGYVVAAPPVATVTAPVLIQAQAPGSEAIIINVPNANGSFTPVKLTKSNDGYIGPQGEYYPGHPTLAQLKMLYGS